MDDLRRKLAAMLGYKLPEQETSPHWQEIQKLLDQVFALGFNAGRTSAKKKL
jgi:hypothetical protein